MQFTREYLEEAYLGKRMTVNEISKINNCNRGKVEYALSKYGIKKGRFKHIIKDGKVDWRLPEFNYYCGLIATDGYVDKVNCRVSVRMRNYGAESVLNNISKFMEFTGYVGGQFRIVHHSEKFIWGALQSINKILGTCYGVTIQRVNQVNYPKIELNASDSKKFYGWVYTGFDEFKLSCKYAKYKLIAG